MDNFNRMLDDALVYIILFVLCLYAIVSLFDNAEYDARRMAALNIEQPVHIDCE